MALDHLGVIAARLRTNALRHQSQDTQNVLQSLEEVRKTHPGEGPLTNYCQVASVLDVKALDHLIHIHQEVSNYLFKRATEDQAYTVCRHLVRSSVVLMTPVQSARELSSVIWGQELAVALKHAANLIEDEGDEDDSKVDKKARAFGTRLKEAMSDIWKSSEVDVFEASGGQEETLRIDSLADELGTIQVLRSHFNPILNVVLQALDAPPVFMRTKALKALGQIVTSDPSILTAVSSSPMWNI